MAGNPDCLDHSINEEHAHNHRAQVLVDRLLTTKRINHKAIIAVLMGAWNLGGNMDIQSLEDNTIICTFQHATDRTHILQMGP